MRRLDNLAILAPCPGVKCHVHPTTPSVRMYTDRNDPEVRCEFTEGDRTFTRYYSRKYAARLLQWWRAGQPIYIPAYRATGDHRYPATA